LKFARDFNARFPGFETDIHGLVEDEVDGELRYFVDCVRVQPEKSRMQK
jgi:arginine decarboxylase